MVFPFAAKSEPSRRVLRVADAAQCAAIHRQSFGAPWSIGEFERLIASEEVLADGIAVDGQALVGFVLSRRAADEAEILTIAVDPTRRGKRLASQLLPFHAAHLMKTGVTKLFLEVEENNAPARALYRRFGFLEVGRRAAYYTGKDGKRSDALVLRLDL